MDKGSSHTVFDSGMLSSVGTPLWTNKNYKILRLPQILDGLIVGSLPYEIQPDTNLVINIDQGSTVYLAIHPKSNSDNLIHLLQTNNWSLLDGKDVIYHGQNGSEVLDQIWFNELLTAQNMNITGVSKALTIAIFIKPGKEHSRNWTLYYL